MKLFLFVFTIVCISSIVYGASWIPNSPNTISVFSVNDKNINKEVTLFSFDKSNNNDDYWANVHMDINASADKDILTMNIKSSKIKNIAFKIFDKNGNVGYYNFSSPICWSKITVSKNMPDYYEESSEKFLENIESIEFIYHNNWFQNGEIFNIWVSDIEIGISNFKPLPKMYNWNWMPKVTPSAVDGYFIDTTIWNTWTIYSGSGWGIGDSEFFGYNDSKSLEIAKNITDYYVKIYKNLNLDAPYIKGEEGIELFEFCKEKNVNLYGEMHHIPEPAWLNEHDVYAVNRYGQKANEVSYTYPEHGYDKTNAELLDYVQKRMYTSAEIGVKAIRTIDYTWTSGGGIAMWGHSSAAKKRWIENLKGIDSKFLIEENGKEKLVGFSEYFKSYYGYIPKPEYCGLKSWDEYMPPTDDMKKNGYYIECEKIFVSLYHYEWVKFVCEAIKPSYEKFGTMVQPILNPEYCMNGTDYYWILKQKRALGVCAEWWGNFDCVYSTYFNGTYVENVAKKNNKDLCLFGETAAAGGSPFGGPEGKPHYYDNISNYLITYAQAGAVDFKSKMDQYIASSFEKISNPNDPEYQSFTGFASAFGGFLQNRNDKLTKPKSNILAISNRAVTGFSGTFDRGYGANDYNLVKYLWNLNILHDGAGFPIEDAYDLNNYEYIFYSPADTPKGFLEKIGSWLKTGNKTLIIHSYCVSRESQPMINFSDFGIEITENQNLKALEFKDLKIGSVKSGEIRIVDKNLLHILEKYDGKYFELYAPLYETSGGKPLITLGGKPLITEFILGSSKIIYLNFAPLKSSSDITNKSVKMESIDNSIQNSRFEEDIVKAIMEVYLKIKPISVCNEKDDIKALKFINKTNSKEQSFVIFNNKANLNVIHGGKEFSNIFQAEDPNIKGTCKINVDKINTDYLIRNMITENIKTMKSDKDGYIEINCDGWNNIGLYVTEI